jgi:hypothetical protein
MGGREVVEAPRRRTILWWGAAVVVLVALAGALVATNPSVGALDAGQRAHAITLDQFNALTVGLSREQVQSQLAKPPYETQHITTGGVGAAPRLQSVCSYYYRLDQPPGLRDDRQRFQLCFDGDELSNTTLFL